LPKKIMPRQKGKKGCAYEFVGEGPCPVGKKRVFPPGAKLGEGPPWEGLSFKKGRLASKRNLLPVKVEEKGLYSVEIFQSERKKTSELTTERDAPFLKGKLESWLPKKEALPNKAKILLIGDKGSDQFLSLRAETPSA